VRFLGYVPDEDMAALYKAAGALVFPTFLGPTAIPILEAFAAGCPVICSNVEGLDEQVGDAGILVDPSRPESIADAIRSVFTDASLRESLTTKSHARSQVLAGGDYGARVSAVVDQVIATLPA
jgi:glycosyltransferase involved in cell wall biosynthesis